ncbi:hypothetical protein CYMTET_16606 [Cymbomonas tetramitiformis]|uniref:Uncharacterized protein n=1 Tax=Cymbomonas tetramitiformis TaxID=36881 RepID=A0AAE0GC00_9CHLO|nr:hypothetical protein CYMTET_16606 [Cymbomonas tetramitiformis]
MRRHGGGPLLAREDVVPALANEVAKMPGLVHCQQAGRVPAVLGLTLRRRHVPHFRLPASYYLQKARRATVGARQPKLAQASKARVYWPVDDAWCSGTVGKTSAVSLTHIAFDDGDEEHLNMDIKEYEAVGPEALQHVSRWGEALGSARGGSRWGEALRERSRGELGDRPFAQLAVQMQFAALHDTTVDNYWSMRGAFIQFCAAEGRSWLMATEVRLSIAHLISKGTIKVALPLRQKQLPRGHGTPRARSC